MRLADHVKAISYLKSDAAQIVKNLRRYILKNFGAENVEANVRGTGRHVWQYQAVPAE